MRKILVLADENEATVQVRILATAWQSSEYPLSHGAKKCAKSNLECCGRGSQECKRDRVAMELGF